jgi:hypothetical protein
MYACGCLILHQNSVNCDWSWVYSQTPIDLSVDGIHAIVMKLQIELFHLPSRTNTFVEKLRVAQLVNESQSFTDSEIS